MLEELVLKTRSYRRFKADEPIARNTLLELVNLARQTASGANLQPLKYMIFCNEPENGKVLETLSWAGYLKDWKGPEVNERPSAYIAILLDTNISKTPGHDVGIAAQTIMLGASEKGFGGCMFGSIDRKKLRESLRIPESLEIVLVLALGRPIENVVLEEAGEDIKYYRDDARTHHVPKRPLSEIVIN